MKNFDSHITAAPTPWGRFIRDTILDNIDLDNIDTTDITDEKAVKMELIQYIVHLFIKENGHKTYQYADLRIRTVARLAPPTVGVIRPIIKVVMGTQNIITYDPLDQAMTDWLRGMPHYLTVPWDKIDILNNMIKGWYSDTCQ